MSKDGGLKTVTGKDIPTNDLLKSITLSMDRSELAYFLAFRNSSGNRLGFWDVSGAYDHYFRGGGKLRTIDWNAVKSNKAFADMLRDMKVGEYRPVSGGDYGASGGLILGHFDAQKVSDNFYVVYDRYDFIQSKKNRLSSNVANGLLDGNAHFWSGFTFSFLANGMPKIYYTIGYGSL
jgi:hypothetical protein